MKKTLLLLALFAIMAASTAAQGRGFGLGIIAGEPTGISFKAWTSSKNAIDGAVAWSLDNQFDMHLHADYLWHNYSLIKTDSSISIPVYFGLGGRIKLRDDNNNNNNRDDIIGLRVPVGIAFLLNSAPIDFFVEVVPVLDLAPDTELDFNAAVGVRYFF